MRLSSPLHRFFFLWVQVYKKNESIFVYLNHLLVSVFKSGRISDVYSASRCSVNIITRIRKLIA